LKYLDWLEVPKSKRLKAGVKHVFFTDHQHDEVIIPELKGKNIFSLTEYIKRFNYGSSHVTSVLLRNCIKWNVPGEVVVGNTLYESDQDFIYFYTEHMGYIKITTLVRGGILFLNGDLFERAYFLVPDELSYSKAMTWLRQMGNLLKPE